jgi:hypothetical protein
MTLRRTGSSRPPAQLESLSRMLDTALRTLSPLGSEDEPGDGILYSGNRHESIPRSLFLDRRLTPLERNAWAVIRLMLQDRGVTSFPTYEQLRPFLTTSPSATKASEETVARALTVLRLTRWLSLVRHRRDPATGRFKGNLYVLHDEALSPYEAIQLDPTYLESVSRSFTHASKAVQDTGYHTIVEIGHDPLLSGRVLPSRLQILIERLCHERSFHETQLDVQEVEGITGNPSSPATGRSSQGSDSEVGENLEGRPLRIPKPASTVRTGLTDIYKEVRTVPRNGSDSSLRLPDIFGRLRQEQRDGALAALGHVDRELQQAVLDEWAVRCNASTVRNPGGYLFGLIQRALRGEFRPWASQTASLSASKDTKSGGARSQIAALRARMRIP